MLIKLLLLLSGLAMFCSQIKQNPEAVEHSKSYIEISQFFYVLQLQLSMCFTNDSGCVFNSAVCHVVVTV
jgi:hypothetical protein